MFDDLFNNSKADGSEASNLILNWSSEILRLYPWFLRLSLILQRLTQ